MSNAARSNSFIESAKTFLRGRFKRREPDVGVKWGDEIIRERKMNEISVYHDSLAQDSRSVDMQTWLDLDMDSVFAKRYPHCARLPLTHHISCGTNAIVFQKGLNLGVKNRFCGGGPISLQGVPAAVGWLPR